jgi:multiple sugar transport system permease protein
MSRIVIENRTIGVLRWVTIAFLLVITVFPFYYMVTLSFVPDREAASAPGAAVGSAQRLHAADLRDRAALRR